MSYQGGRLEFRTTEAARAKITVFDTRGAAIAQPVDKSMNAGAHEIPLLPGRPAGSVAIVRLALGDKVSEMKIMTCGRISGSKAVHEGAFSSAAKARVAPDSLRASKPGFVSKSVPVISLKDTVDFMLESDVVEYITTPEKHGLTSANDVAQVRRAFAAAIADASAHASESTTGRGVVELEPRKVYACMPEGNGSNVNPTGAINLTSATPNVEIRTKGKPILGGSQAILKLDNLSGYGGGGNKIYQRCILKGQSINNVVVGWVTFDGNMPSAGADYSARRTWLQNNVEYNHGGDGGMCNIHINGGTGLRLYQVESKNAQTDGISLRDATPGGTGPLTNVRFEDCDFHHNRRQGMTIDRMQNTSATWDDLYFLRCKFRETGEQPDMPGEGPGSGVDVEPLFDDEYVYGVTFDDCDFSDNHGYTMINGGVRNWELGRGLAYDGAPVCRYHRIIGCRMERNRVAGFLSVNSNVAVALPVQDFVIKDCAMRDNGNELGYDNAFEFAGGYGAGDGKVKYFSVVCSNNEFTVGGNAAGGYVLAARCADTGHLISCYRGNFAVPTFVSNGQTTMTISDGLAP
jgi:hypothetical protein